MKRIDTLEQPNSIFEPNSLLLKICLVVMFLLAALIRGDEIRAPGHLIEREYNSAIFAQAFYVSGNEDVKQWQKDIAFAARDQLPMLEPPLTEYLVSLIYRVMGREEIWYARYLTSLFWLIGGVFLYKTIQALASIEAALIGAGYYLFAPWSIIISRSFQPDSLMMMMFLISLYVIVLYFKKPNWRRLIIASLLTGITLLLRPLVLFALFSAFGALSIYKNKNGSWKQLINWQLFVFVLVSVMFPLAFYGYGIYVAGFLQGQADLSFRPYLLPRWKFWQGWFELGTMVTGLSFLLLAILGFFTLRNNLTRFLIAGLTIGYLFFGLVFTFHVHTHPYYHIQALPIIAICASPFLITLINTFRKLAGRNWLISITVCLVAVLYFSWRDVKNTFYTAIFENPSLAWEVGENVKHSPHTVFVAYHYGLPLEYYGQLSGLPWPVSIDDPFYRRPDAQELSVQERLDGLGFTPEYFVITNFELYHRKHQDLNAYLENYCSPIAETNQYLIYANCTTMMVE